jgi:predicted O-linked N-acetylglucosamine transferase (SPINDLY family)
MLSAFCLFFIGNTIMININDLLQQANKFGAAGDLKRSINCVEQVLEQEENNLPALQIAVMAYFQLGQLDAAGKYTNTALTYFPDHPLFNNLTGVIACQQGNYEKGITYCKKAVEAQPNYSEAIYNLALAYQKTGELSQALKYLNNAAQHAPNIPDIHNSIGNILQQQGDFIAAEKALQKAVDLAPNYLSAWMNLGVLYNTTNEMEKALTAFQKVIELNPSLAEGHDNLGVVLQKFGKYEAAITSFKQALQCNQKLKPASLHLASLLAAGDVHPEACEILQKALELMPNDNDLLANLVNTKKACCDWQNLDVLEEKLLQQTMQQIANNEHVSLAPFSSLACWTSAEQQYAIACNHAKFYMQNFPQQLNFNYAEYKKNNKIKLAYISPNFRNHPTTQNVLGLLQKHDRSKYEIYIYSLNDDDGSIERKNVIEAADYFCDLSKLNYLNAAKKINADGIDVIISLMGYIDRSRIEILASHPCPVQIGYQSFAGTLGNNIYDYFIADKTVIPEENVQFYSEKIINMPYSYYAIDVTKPQNIEISRQECGLPEKKENKFVYCCFCSHYKVEPQAFGLWMKILQAVPDSVLWLFGKLEHIKQNLRQAASQHGVDPERLIFAGGRNKQYHLARHKYADLFLDTLIYGAHTTAVDSLKMGVPLITLPGNTLVTKVSAALLKAIKLPELIVKNKEEYVMHAIYYAQNPQELAKIKAKLKNNFATTPLFNLDNYVRYFEAGIDAAWHIYQQGSNPQQIDIPKNGSI